MGIQGPKVKISFCFQARFQVIFRIALCVEVECMELLKQGVRMESIATNNISQELNSGAINLLFSCLLGALGDTFYDFWSHGTGSEFHRFSGVAGGGPELRERTSGGGKMFIQF